MIQVRIAPVFVLAMSLAGTPFLPGLDCNGNGQDDDEEIASGAVADCNTNNIPDECEGPPFNYDSPLTFSLPNQARDVLFEDLNGDSVLDLAVGYFGGIIVQLATGNENALESIGVSYEVDQFISRRPWEGADLDGDGDVDLVSVDGEGLVVLYNRGDGSFEEPIFIAVSPGLTHLSLGDLTGDGSADVVLVARVSARAFVLLTDAGGEFNTPVEYATGDGPQGIELGDLNGDDDLDVAIVNRTSADVTMLLGDGAGGFSSGTALAVGAANPSTLAIDDWNNDGQTDIAVGAGSEVRVWFNTSAGFAEQQSLINAAGGSIVALTSADLDENGDRDLTATYGQPGQVHLYRNTGGRFNAAIVLPIVFGASHLEIGDITRDGLPDLGLLSTGSRTVRIVASRETAPLLSFASPVVHDVEGEPHCATIGDFNGNGFLDVITGNNNCGTLSFLFNRGDGTLAVDVRSSFTNVFYITSADLDLDGDLDLITANTNRIVHTAFNDGNGGFGEVSSQFAGANCIHVFAEDVNGDQYPDLVTSNRGDDTISIFFNNRDRTFERQDRGVGTAPLASAVGDLDGDGLNDIAVASGREVRVFLHDASGGLVEDAEIYPVASDPTYILVVDLDNDDAPDVVAGLVAGLAVFWNTGDPDRVLEPAVEFSGGTAYSLISADVNGDEFQDIITTEESPDGRVRIFLNTKNRGLELSSVLPTGNGPRYAVAGDIDADGDVDIVGTNRLSRDAHIFENQSSDIEVGTFLTQICTPADYFNLSIPTSRNSAARRIGKYVVAARDEAGLHDALFQNVNVFVLHEDFLAETFPDEFGHIVGDPNAYQALVGRRTTRDYFVGTVELQSGEGGFFYTFTVAVDTGFDPREVLSQNEVADLYNLLRGSFQLEPLFYTPLTQLEREAVESWDLNAEPPLFIDDRPPAFQYEAYTLGVGYGRVRLMTLEEFNVANEAGRFTVQDGVVVEDAPQDIEGVVGFIFTGKPQGPLSHLAVRTGRRGTPNAYVADALKKFAEHEGKIVRVEVFPENFFVTEVPVEEAELFWEQNLRELPQPPSLDVEFSDLHSYLEMHLRDRPEGRYGGKATNLARLQRVLLGLGGEFDEYIEAGFAIPMHYYQEFMRSNTRHVSGREVSYEEYLFDLLHSERFRTDSEYRFAALDEFRDFARAHGVVREELAQALALKIESEFGDPSTMVRFRSSSNVEDALVFNGAGLYESTSVCAPDSFDGVDRGDSFCDPGRGEERTIQRALKKVWTSLWTFRAHEERTFYQIDPQLAAMGLAVTRTFLTEAVNGVAFTGSPREVEDKRYVITAQVGDESVVSPRPGTQVERTLLEVGEGGEVLSIERQTASNLVEPGGVVMGDEAATAVGRAPNTKQRARCG